MPLAPCLNFTKWVSFARSDQYHSAKDNTQVGKGVVGSYRWEFDYSWFRFLCLGCFSGHTGVLGIAVVLA